MLRFPRPTNLPWCPGFWFVLFTFLLPITSFAIPRMVVEDAPGASKVRGTVVAWGNNTFGQTNVPPSLSGVTAIAAGEYHTVALKSDGTVVAWGYNYSGQATVPAGLTGVIAIEAGDSHTVALKGDGTVVAWGSNSYGQTSVPMGLSGVTAITAGSLHTVALKNNGTVVAWGNNSVRQSNVPAGLTGVTAVAAGYSHTVALKSDGTIVVWGFDTADPRIAPPGVTGAISIATGPYHTVVLKNDGTVVEYISHSSGVSSVPPSVSGVIAIAAGYLKTVALKNDGTVLEWSVSFGLLADAPNSLAGVTAIAAGSSHTVALLDTPVSTLDSQFVGVSGSPMQLTIKNTGTENLVLGAITKDGAHGDDFAISAPLASTVPPGESTTLNVIFTPSATGTRRASIHIASNDTVKPNFDLILAGSGLGSSNATLSGLTLGAGSLVPAFANGVETYSTTVPQEVANLTFTPTCADANATVRVNGILVPSGSASGGIPLIGGANTITVVVTAENGTAQKTYTIAVTRNSPRLVLEQPVGSAKNRGVVVAWGDNSSGQTNVPPGLADVSAIASGYDHRVALKRNGTVVAWGNGYATGVPLGLTGVTAIAAGDTNTLALKSDGTVVAWGLNAFGTTKVPLDLAGVTAIAAGDFHMVALKSDGIVVAWGNNLQGQSITPSGLIGVTAIAAGASHALALKSDGTVVAWGDNYKGQTTVPAGLTDVIAIAADESYSLALKRNGAAVYWGSINQTIMLSEPTSVTGILAIGSLIVVSKNDGTVSVVGYDAYGEGTLPPGLTGVTAITDRMALIESPVSDLGREVVGRVGSPIAVTLRNGGNGDMTLGTITMDGSNPGDFSVSAPFTTTVPPGGSTTFTITFTPGALGLRSAKIHIPSNDDGSSVFDLILTGTGLLPDNADLADLALSAGTLSPLFASDTTSYTVSVPNVTDKITLTPNQAGNKTTIKVNGLTVASGAASASITLIPGDNTITTTVTAENGTTKKTYTVTVTRHAPHLVVEHPSGVPRKGGTVVAWGDNSSGQTTVPTGLKNIKNIAAGGTHTIALKSDGTVVAWGNNSKGQTTVPAGLTSVTAIAAGSSHSVALKSDGTVVVWGDNTYNQRITPTGLTSVILIAAGGNHTVALKNDGTVVAWGYNPYGQTNVPFGLINVTSLAAGGNHTVALKNDGTVVAWGFNYYGQTIVPAGLANVTSIAVNGNHTVALKGDGTVVAWGQNDFGQTIVPTVLKGVIAVTAGQSHTVALKNDGTVVAWGDDSHGKSTVPNSLVGVTAISAGVNHSAALIELPGNFGNQVINVIGTPVEVRIRNSGIEDLLLGEIGVDGANAADFVVSPLLGTTLAPGASTTFTLTFTPGGLGARTAVMHIPSNESGASPFSLILEGTGLSVSDNANLSALELSAGILSPVLSDGVINYQVTVPYATDGLTLTPYKAHTGATIRVNGTVLVSGNPSGVIPLKPGSNTITVVVTAQNATSVKTHTITVIRTFPQLRVEDTSGIPKNRGQVVAWSDINTDGQINVPTGLGNVTAIASAYYHTLALKGDGTVVGWGRNDYGQTNIPAGLTGIIAVAAGRDHSLALRSNGTVVAWGLNTYGQTTIPAGLTGVKSISAGSRHSVALKTNGTVVTWGDNTYGQRSVPASLTNVTAISAGYYFNLALKADGTVVAWGNNTDGQINVPAGLSGVTAIAAGYYHSLALKNNGTVAAWGANSSGQSTLPSALAGVTAIAGGGYHSVALKGDGTCANWGYFNYAPNGLAGVTALTAGTYHCVALIGDQVSAMGSRNLGAVGAPQTFWIRNMGSQELVLGEITKSGLHPGDFLVSPPVAASIAPGGSTSFTITFTPSAVGDRSAVMRLPTNDPLLPYFDLTLSGVGTLSPIQVWRQGIWGSIENTGDAADPADPDNDGLPNLLEFAFGSSPTTASSMKQNVSTSGGETIFTYRRRLPPRGFIMGLESADSPGGVFSWVEDSGSEVLGNDGVTEEVRLTIPNNGKLNRFFRIRLTLP